MTVVQNPTRFALVLDTSIFTNPDSYAQWGADHRSVLEAFTAMAMQLQHRVEFFMPPLVYRELETFLSTGDVIPPGLAFVLHQKSPDRHGVSVPGALLYELIEDIRERINRGLRVAEGAVRAVQSEKVEEIIGRLRDRYRAALRSGLLDSREDVDLVLLARELDAALVSADRGVRTWADKLGIRLIDPSGLRAMLQSLIEHDRAIE